MNRPPAIWKIIAGKCEGRDVKFVELLSKWAELELDRLETLCYPCL